MAKIVCISDTHTHHKSVILPPGDILIHAGDFTSRGKGSEIIEFGDWFREQPHQYKIVIAGNHDWAFERTPEAAREWLGAGITYLQDEMIVIVVDGKSYNIYGSPWQPEFCNWAFNLPRGQALKEKWDAIPETTDILITHGPPVGILDMCDHGLAVGCQDLLNAVKRVVPKLHIFGHIHESYGTYHSTFGTTFINASTCNLRYSPSNSPIVINI